MPGTGAGVDPPLSYAQLLAVFVFVPVAGFLLAGNAPDRRRRPTARAGILILVTLAMAWTIPWDNYLVETGVWFYAEGSVLFRIGHAPVEEYTFIATQSVLTSLWVYHVGVPEDVDLSAVGRAPQLVGAGLALAVSAAGVLALLGPGFYLGAIVVWAVPLIALQWGVGGHYLWRTRRTLAVALAVPTAYLWVVDRIAIGWGLWRFDAAAMTGLDLLGLPVEEALFFLVTNALVVQGLFLFHWLVEDHYGYPNVRAALAARRNGSAPGDAGPVADAAGADASPDPATAPDGDPGGVPDSDPGTVAGAVTAEGDPTAGRGEPDIPGREESDAPDGGGSDPGPDPDPDPDRAGPDASGGEGPDAPDREAGADSPLVAPGRPAGTPGGRPPDGEGPDPDRAGPDGEGQDGEDPDGEDPDGEDPSGDVTPVPPRERRGSSGNRRRG